MSDDPKQTEVLRRAALPEDEQSLLDTALQESDQLLARSLHDDQQRRNRRRLFWSLTLVMGGVVMTAFIVAVLMGWFAFSTHEMAEAKGSRPTSAEIEQAEAFAAKGWKTWQAGQPADAVESFEQSVELNPKLANGWNGLGWAAFNSGQTEKALRAFRQCLKLVPKHPAALNGLGQIYLFRADYKQAERYLKKAAPRAPAAQYGLARLYLIQGKFDKALPWIEKVAANPGQAAYVDEMLAAAKKGELSDDLGQKLEPLRAPRKETKVNSLITPGDLEDCLEDLRRTAICYNLSFDQVLDEHLSRYDERRLELFPSQAAWPEMLGYITKDPAEYRALSGDLADYSGDYSGGIAFAEPLAESIVVDARQTLVFLDGISAVGAVLIDSYATVYCHGDMAGVINSQSYSTVVIRGIVTSGRMRNASYGNWVIYGDMSGEFQFESAGTLRILGRFAGKIELGSGGHKRRGKVFLDGYTPKSELDRITGTGTVYLEQSDLEDGNHEVGSLTVIVGDDY